MSFSLKPTLPSFKLSGLKLPGFKSKSAQSAARASADVRPETKPYDSWLLFCATCLLVTGFLMISSASMEVATEENGTPFYYSIRHLVFMAIGAVAALFTFFFSSRFWLKTGHLWLLLALVLLVIVLIPGIGNSVGGARRWIALGPINLQASELAKMFMVIFMGGYLARRLEEVRTQWSGFIKAMAVLVLFLTLLLMEPDFGASAIMLCTVMGMIFLSGMRLGQFAIVVLVGVVAMAQVAVLAEYRQHRLTNFLDPWADPFGHGYQLVQAQIAYGRGEIFGQGLGNSIQKLFYLPEAHTDFVFSVLAEEMGMIGALLVVVLFAVMVTRIFRMGHKAESLGRHFQAYVCFGFGFIFAGQALVNIGVNVGLLPTKGLTLPLVSYGGSSLVVSMVMLAILCRIYAENHFLEKKAAEGSFDKRAAEGTLEKRTAEGSMDRKQLQGNQGGGLDDE